MHKKEEKAIYFDEFGQYCHEFHITGTKHCDKTVL